MSYDSLKNDDGNFRPKEEWMPLAKCREIDHDYFYSDNPILTERALSACKVCIVQRDCLQYAIVHHEKGIWGGKTERQRRRILRSVAIIKAQS